MGIDWCLPTKKSSRCCCYQGVGVEVEHLGTGMFYLSHKTNMGYWCMIWYGKCSFDVWFYHILPTSYYRWMIWDMDSWFSWFIYSCMIFVSIMFQHTIMIHKIHGVKELYRCVCWHFLSVARGFDVARWSLLKSNLMRCMAVINRTDSYGPATVVTFDVDSQANIIDGHASKIIWCSTSTWCYIHCKYVLHISHISCFMQ